MGWEWVAICSRQDGQDGPHRRVLFEHRCEGGALCQNLDNCNNHKSKHLPRTDSIWKGATESPDTGI